MKKKNSYEKRYELRKYNDCYYVVLKSTTDLKYIY